MAEESIGKNLSESPTIQEIINEVWQLDSEILEIIKSLQKQVNFAQAKYLTFYPAKKVWTVQPMLPPLRYDRLLGCLYRCQVTGVFFFELCPEKGRSLYNCIKMLRAIVAGEIPDFTGVEF